MCVKTLGLALMFWSGLESGGLEARIQDARRLGSPRVEEIWKSVCKPEKHEIILRPPAYLMFLPSGEPCRLWYQLKTFLCSQKPHNSR
ncbi:hypothetical protein N7468_006928 [Penicillium chermesinum]|uniref:Secreted protein n=1 Tax=Penicillium chermesinum TaxID=63820 RepID=A0A9W9NTI1_9EURO|nr:uncharacterized protein N7468_006928 [Penicillium chermesinum]KAJ5225703.1 hypothetical protein N7468_006928 [Penicillium chermesinum]